MDLHERLATAGAPEALSDWARDEALDFDGAWQRCDRADHRVWLAACGGVPIETLIEAAAGAVYLAEARAAGSPEAISDTLDLAVSRAEPTELIRAADACEQLSTGGLGDYRSALGPGAELRARAAALVARAAEALHAGEAQREAGRLERARSVGANLGIGMQAVLPRQEGPVRLEVLAAAADPAQGMFLYCVAACAQVTLDARESLVRLGDAEPDAEQAIDAAIHDAIVSAPAPAQ